AEQIRFGPQRSSRRWPLRQRHRGNRRAGPKKWGARAGLSATVPSSKNALDLPAAVERAVLAVAQEGCTNALRHAPSAPIHLRLRTEADGVELEVENGAPEDKVMLPAAPQGTG